MKNKLFILLSLFIQIVNAQQLPRIEINIDNSENQVMAVSLKENGVIHLDKNPKGILKIRRFDNYLSELWSLSTEIPQNTEIIKEYSDESFMYLLLQPSKSDILMVMKISTQIGGIQKFYYKTFKSFDVTHFKAKNNFICIGGLVKKEPILVFCEEENNLPKFISNSLKGEAMLQTVNIENDQVNVTFLNKENNQTIIIYRSFSRSGKILNTKNILPNREYDFLSTKYFKAGAKNVLVGNYGFKGATNADFSSSQGIFVYDLEKNGSAEYYSFDEMPKFFNFLNDKQKQKIDKLVQKKKDKGSEYRFDYRLLINEVLADKDKLIISSEVYMPVYRTNNSNMYMGSPMGGFYYPGYGFYSGLRPFYAYNMYNYPSLWGYNQRTLQYLESFSYLEGMVLAIDENGKLVWDETIPYNNLKYYELKPHLKIGIDSAKTVLSYVNKNKLEVKEILPDGSVARNTAIENEVNPKTTKSQDSGFENIEFWYNNFFLNWGVDKSKNLGTKKGYVSFIEKIPF